MFKLDHYSFENRLDDVSLSISQGEVALLGPSGGGKTSLLNAMHQQAADAIAWCPQTNGLVDSLSSYHNIYMGQLDQHNALYNVANLINPLAKPKQQVSALTGELGIKDQLWKAVKKLSGGQHQRVGIARAFYRQQNTFLGDEPVSSLDPVQAQAILQLINQRYSTVVVALHNRKQALENYSRIIGIKSGRIIFDSPAKELVKNKYQASLLDSLYD